jgi:hypothetical protein
MHVEHTLEPVHEEIDGEAPRRSKRQRTAKFFGDDFTIYPIDDTPTTILEAFASANIDDWKEAVHNKIDLILSNGTWGLVDRPYVCKWVFRKKIRPNGNIDKYKAMLVAKGYTQKEGKDLFDTYSPIGRLTTIHILLSLATPHGLLVH